MTKITIILTIFLSLNAYSNDKLYGISEQLFNHHKEKLKAHGYTHEPDLRIDDPSSEACNAYVDPNQGYDENNLTTFYLISIGGGCLGKKVSLLETMTVIAHELGHLIGKKMSQDRTTTEGEADYQSGQILLSLVVKEKSSFIHEYKNPLLETKIATTFKLNPKNAGDLAKIKIAAASYDTLLRSMEKKESIQVPISPNPKPVTETLEFYPSIQIRWDTIISGLLGLPRPVSWAHPRDF